MGKYKYNNLQMAYRTNIKSGLVFLHGLGSNKETWQKQFEYFDPHHLVLAVDLLNHGISTNNVDIQIAPRLNAQIIDRLILERFQLPFIVIGHSVTAAVLVELMLLKNPFIKGIVFLDCPVDSGPFMFSKCHDALQTINESQGSICIIEAEHGIGSNPDNSWAGYLRNAKYHLVNNADHNLHKSSSSEVNKLIGKFIKNTKLL